jgi:uncharacterized protein (TIRG00374 family)
LQRSAIAVIGLAASAISLFLLAHVVDLGQTARILGATAVAPLIVGLAVFQVGLALRFWICRTLLPSREDGSRVPIGRVAPVVLVGLLGNVLLPARFGEVIRAYLFSRREGLPFGGAVGSTALERILDTVTLAVMAFLAAVVAGSTGWIIQGTGLLAAAGIILIVALATTGLTPLVRFLGRLATVGPLGRPVSAVMRRLSSFVYWSGGAHRRGPIALALGLSAVAWLANAAMFLLVGGAVGVQVSPAGALLIMAVTVLATAIPSAPASVGTFELAAVTAALSLGVPADTALAMAVLAHGVSLLSTLVGGPLALAYVGWGGLRGLSGAALSEVGLEPPIS